MKKYLFWGLHASHGKKFGLFLAIIPFILCISVYSVFSSIRHKENSQDKILPTITQMKDAVVRMGFKEDRRTGKYLLWQDMKSSLIRLFVGILAASFVGLLIGLNMGIFPGLEGLGLTFLTVISIIPPLAILPILFITFGVDEFAKIILIFIGTFPLIARDIFLYTKQVPREQIIKSLSLGASELQLVYRIVLPQVIPRLIDTTRLSFGAAWLFLIAAEAIASVDGLGYRIFLVRRYLAMDVIIPYVLTITALGFSIDFILKQIVKRKFVWYASE